VLEFGDQITYLGMFPYTFDRAGNLGVIDDRIAREAAAEKNIATIMVVTNLEAGDFSTDLGGVLLSDPALQERLLDQIIEVALERGMRGVNFDFERLPEDAAAAYNAFLRRAAARLAEHEMVLSTDLAPKISPYQAGIWYAAHDYQAQGTIVDWATIMTYDWGWPGGPPEPVAPLPDVIQVLEFALTQMPPEKISMGIPLYGYDWILPFVPGNPPARAWTLGQIIDIAVRHQVPIQFDTNAQSPFIRYRDEQGRDHIVWFEDARSIQAKIEQVRNFGLRGASLWRLPFSAAQAWLLIDDNFIVRKVG
jgi:spore germination protein